MSEGSPTATLPVVKIPPDEVASFGQLSEREITLMRIGMKWAMRAAALGFLGDLDALLRGHHERNQLSEQLIQTLEHMADKAYGNGLKDGFQQAQQAARQLKVDVDAIATAVRKTLHDHDRHAAARGDDLRGIVRREVMEAFRDFVPEIKVEMPSAPPTIVNESPATRRPAQLHYDPDDIEVVEQDGELFASVKWDSMGTPGGGGQ